jgi:hypothetical protein
VKGEFIMTYGAEKGVDSSFGSLKKYANPALIEFESEARPKAAAEKHAKQRCLDVIEQMPAEYLVNVAASLEAMYAIVEGMADMAYCLELYRNSFDEDNNEPECLEEFAKRLGVERG